MALKAVQDPAQVDFSFLLPSFRGGGAEISTIRLANKLSEKGFRVDCVALRSEGAFSDRILPAVEVHDLHARRAILSLGSLVGHLRRQQPRILIANMSHINVVSVIARRLAKTSTQLLLVEHNDLLAGLKLEGSLKGAVLRWMMRYSYPQADLVAAVSQGAADSLEKAIRLPPGSVKVLPNGIDVAAIQESIQTPVNHSWLQEAHVIPVVTSIGRLVPQKDYQTLLHAFARLREKMSVRLMIMGEGYLRPALEKTVNLLGLSEDVELSGFNPEPLPSVARSDLYVLSSRYEGQGVVLLEAMACGVPIVSTDCPSGPAEVLGNGAAGQLVPVGSSEELASAMYLVLTDAGLRSDYRLAGLSRVQNYDLEHSVSRFLELVSKLEA